MYLEGTDIVPPGLSDIFDRIPVATRSGVHQRILLRSHQDVDV